MNLLKISFILSFLFGSTFLFGVTTPPIDHTQWDGLVKKYVDTEGLVNYKGFLEDKKILEDYLQLISTNTPDKKTWSKDEQLAYWINAYNAFTVKLIVDHYPVESIKDIKKGVPFVSTVWDMEFFSIGGKEMNLNDIEHGIIRKEFKEPRIHFAVNCASYSCPPLRNEAFTAANLDAQLTDQLKVFLADTRKNKINNPDKIEISSLFKWYSTDFTDKGFFSRIFGKKNRDKRLIQFITPYVEEQLTKDTKIEFVDYKWTLNEQ